MQSVVRMEIRRVLEQEPWWAEFWSAATAVLWAGMTYLSLERFYEWPSVRVLSEIGDGRFWCLLGFGLGFSQVVALAMNRRWARWVVALAQGWFWGVLTLGVWIAEPWSPAVAVYAGWCAINVFSIVRLLRPLPCSVWRLL